MTQPGMGQTWTSVLGGEGLRQLRRQRGLSQEELAGRAGISRATVARLERRPRLPYHHRTLARLAAALVTARPPQAAADEAGTIHTRRLLIAAARELLARTAELPDSRRELLAVLSEYRAALFDFAAEGDEQ